MEAALLGGTVSQPAELRLAFHLFGAPEESAGVYHPKDPISPPSQVRPSPPILSGDPTMAQEGRLVVVVVELCTHFTDEVEWESKW